MGAWPIEHVVVLMMENHSFDHLLGWLPGVGDLTPAVSASADPSDPGAPRFPMTADAPPVIATNPAHSVPATSFQLFGTADPLPWAVPTMEWFVADYVQRRLGRGEELMQSYAPSSLPVLTNLARTFAVCTAWFASVPGPTTPNRLFANCASSGGFAGDAFLLGDLPRWLGPLDSIFARLSAAGRTWGVFHEDGDFASEMILDVVSNDTEAKRRDRGLARFLAAAAEGSLPDYCFLTPGLGSTSQHPPADVRRGEHLIADVYEAVRRSPLWPSTLLVVTYDEHGGFFDLARPPGQLRNPDGRVSEDPPFDFTRLGVRVPAVVVSAYTEPFVDSTVYEHASIPATVEKLFGLAPLTERDATAAELTSCLHRATPRDDAPTVLPRPPGRAVPPASGRA